MTKAEELALKHWVKGKETEDDKKILDENVARQQLLNLLNLFAQTGKEIK